ncbi:MAG: tRNA (adenosine(37)-N6)-threonylcarbamoyltransferase complex transferase subunit TsaD [Planctomycetota bacterium]|nr:MAG: tRNA (adenosine(37)-N6)-threonylcarbamoyltransferase complex transferase subunit TsaD [Planctomycetota bacterium]
MTAWLLPSTVPQTILGIESSCDETAVALVARGRQVLASEVRSQVAEHAAWGGVVPEIAGRGHLQAIVPALESCLQTADCGPEQVDAIAVTCRPGLLGSLLVGLNAAKALAWAWRKPLIGVHHIEAHLYAALMGIEEWQFPYISLVVSGGHTNLFRSDSPLQHQRLGCTRDDAAGEALDKAAATLGLGYPGGPAIQKAGQDGDPQAFSFKRPMLSKDSLDFSFSGLKTALLYTLKGPGGKRSDPDRIGPERQADLCASFESAIVDTLAKKCLRACRQQEVPRLLIGGGVARNRRLRSCMEQIAAENDLQVHFAAPEHCTDNADMIAGLGHAYAEAGRFADLNLEAQPR